MCIEHCIQVIAYAVCTAACTAQQPPDCLWLHNHVLLPLPPALLPLVSLLCARTQLSCRRCCVLMQFAVAAKGARRSVAFRLRRLQGSQKLSGIRLGCVLGMRALAIVSKLWLPSSLFAAVRPTACSWPFCCTGRGFHVVVADLRCESRAVQSPCCPALFGLCNVYKARRMTYRPTFNAGHAPEPSASALL